jgi:IclR family acetate operon transcriptional repressor
MSADGAAASAGGAATHGAADGAAASADRRRGGVQAVDRALDVLETLAEAGAAGSANGSERGLALSQIAERTGLPFGTIHRMLRTLAARGYIRQEADRRYALGTALLRLSTAGGQLLGPCAEPYLARLVDLSGETANLAVMEGDTVVYVAQVPSPRRLRLFAEVGRRVLPHCTAVGKVLLAAWPDDEAARLLARTGMPRRTPRTHTGRAELLAELAWVRARGYAVDRGEEELDVRCVAVPVRDGDRIAAALSVSGPAGRMAVPDRGPGAAGFDDPDDLAGLAASMTKIAEEFSADVFGARRPGRS